MLEEGLLEHDHITLNTIIYCVTKQQTDNQKFIHGRMITCYINYRASRKKSTQPTSMKTMIFASKHRL